MAPSSSAAKKAPPASSSVRRQLSDANANIDYYATNPREPRFPGLLSIQQIDKQDKWAPKNPDLPPSIDDTSQRAEGLPTLVLGIAPRPNPLKTKMENTKVDRGHEFLERISCHIKFDNHWIPKVLITLDIQFFLPQGSKKKEYQQTSLAVLAFPPHNIDALQYRRVQEIGDLDQSVYPGHSEQELEASLGGSSYEISFEAQGSIHASNVFPVDPNFGCHDKALEHLRTIVRRPTRVSFLTRDDEIPVTVEFLRFKIIEQQKRKTPLYKQFFPTGNDNNIMVQQGNFVRKKDRANGKQFPAPSFFKDVPEWLIYVVYCELEGHEYQDSLRKAVPVKGIWTRLPGTEISASEELGEEPYLNSHIVAEGEEQDDPDEADVEPEQFPLPETATTSVEPEQTPQPEASCSSVKPESTPQPEASSSSVEPDTNKSIGDSRYLVIVKGGCLRTKLKPEDMADIFFDSYLSNTRRYECKVLEAIPYAGLNDIVLQVDRPFGPAGWERTDLGDKDMPKLEEIKNPRDAFRVLQQTPPKLIWLRQWNEEKTFKQAINTIRAVYNKIKTKDYPHIQKYIVGNDLTPDTFVDLWAANENFVGANMEQLKDDTARVASYLNEEQKLALNQYSRAPDGWTFVKGCAGTGKTEVLKVVCTLMALQRKEIPGPTKIEEQGALGLSAPGRQNEQQANKIFLALKRIANPWLAIIVVPINKAANDLADAMHPFLKSHVSHREAIVVRVYPYKTEDDIIRRAANRLRPKRKPDIHIPFVGTVTEMLAGQQILFQYQKNTRNLFGINDKRMTSLEHAIGTWVLKFAALGTYKDHPLAQPQLFAHFRTLYKRYMTDPFWEEEDSVALSQEIGDAVAYVLLRADVVIMTPSSLAEYRIRLPIKYPRLLAYDEAGRITDVGMCSGLGQVNPKVISLCGDSTQGTAINNTPHSENQFVSYGKVSFLGRCIVNGTSVVELHIQNRFHPDICDVISPVWYDHKLLTGKGPMQEERSRLLKNLAKRWFGKDKNCIWVNIKDGATRVNATKSQFNSYNVGITTSLVRRLLEEKSIDIRPRNIGILTPYNAQYQLYRRAQAWLQTQYQDLDMSEMVIEKFDNIQGGQVDIVINDFTIVDTAGFLTRASRPLLAASRARQLEINIGNVTQIEKIKRLKGCHLRSFITEHKKRQMLYNWTDDDELNKAKYLPPDYDTLVNVNDQNDPDLDQDPDEYFTAEDRLQMGQKSW
ncbi:MAG: hypothetical protein Q9165_000740 [Trypethelium subeluteriae]